MGPTKKQKDKIKKMNEARLRQLEEARRPVCSSVGGVTRSTPEKEACPYDIHTRLVKATVNASSGYVGIRELGKSLQTNMISETRYNVLAKKMYKEDCDKLESVMVKTYLRVW